MSVTAQDERFMRRALRLAQRGRGRTSPNPLVGAVLTRGGRVIGEGWHRQAGGPHAEILALRRANARGATLYVTLEPCSSWGRTPPCADAIIAAGVRRVVVAAADPNPKHNRRGLRRLRAAGIRVEAGLLADAATRLNDAFNKWIVTGLPLVTVKSAVSLDGKIATRSGDSQWISSRAARRYAHKLRAQTDAILVGAGTVLADNPSLTIRHGVRGRQPLRVIVDTRGRCPTSSTVFTDRHRHRTLVMTGRASDRRWREQLARQGVAVAVLPARAGHLDMRRALQWLGKQGITNLLVEGGGGLPGALFDARLVDKVAFFFAPLIIGGRNAVTAVQGDGAALVKTAWQFRRHGRWRRLGDGEMLFEGCRGTK
jgi:diaminohydroxyphosphoribosylaminopyrimidine deaminase/5-amino-6-(5-phosphoribosylamino)uracil reductase